jgi:hypothetical protein
MASSTNLEERFYIAVRTIQNLPPNGEIDAIEYENNRFIFIQA